MGSIVLGWKSNISSLLRSLGGNVKNQGTGQKKISPRKFYLGQLQQFEMKNQIVSFSVYSNLKIVYNAARFILFIQSRKPLLVQVEKLSWNRKGIITFFASHYPFFVYHTSISILHPFPPLFTSPQNGLEINGGTELCILLFQGWRTFSQAAPALEDSSSLSKYFFQTNYLCKTDLRRTDFL